MAHGAALLFDLIARDGASPAFLKVAGAADKAAASTARAQKSMAGASALAARSGAKLTKGLTLPLAAVAAVSVNQAAKYQKSMTLIATVTEQSVGDVMKSSKGLMTIAKSTGTNLNDLTEALYTVEKGGFRGAKALAIVKASAQGAKAEGTDLATAANALTSVMASYGKTLGDPIAAQNEIIKGAGLSKTTMQDFANSLSNVVPVAASLKIPFSDVAAAISTMTQHGETAQHATDNLRNLITNLAGQNNVAAQAMQQLGISGVDVARKLSKQGPGGGLVGALDYVLNRTAKMSHGGEIVVSAFKKASLATSSLKTMLTSMSGPLKANSEGLLKGTTSLKDYRAYALSLGGKKGAQALDFLSLVKSSQGFSNMVKSGKGDVLTYATALQKMLGGVTGMNVALQVSGESAETFHRNAEEISHAARHVGGDVLGWSKTQGTLAVKLDKAKASLQVMAVELGTALIPAVSKVVDWIGKAVHWFDSLTGTDKKVLLWSIGIVAALGPVLSIGSKLATVGGAIGRFVGSAAGGLATLAGRSEASAGRIARSMRTATGALAGAGLGYAAGQVAGNTKGKKGLVYGALGGAATGALAGAAIGGAPGALIGGAAGAVAGVIGAYNRQGDAAKHAGDAAKEALRAQKAAAEDLLGVLENVAGAYNDQYRQNIAHKLTTTGALGIAQKAGIQGKSVLDAVSGSTGSAGQANLRVAIENAQASGKISWKQGKVLLDQLQQLQGAALTAERQLQSETRALGKNLLTSDQLGTSVDKLKGAFSATGRALGTTTAAGLRNNEIVRENVAVINQSAVSQLKHGKSVGQVAAAYQSQIGTLTRNMTALGFNREEVLQLVGSYGSIPKSVRTALLKTGVRPADIDRILTKYAAVPASKTTDVTAIDNATVTLANIQSAYAALPSTYHLNVIVDEQHHRSSGNSASGGKKTGPGRASGGGAPEGYFSVGEEGPEIVRKDGANVHVLSNRQSRALIERTGWMFPGFAKGTKGSAAKAKQAASAKQDALRQRVSTGISGIGQAYSPPFTVADIGSDRLASTISSAVSKLDAAIRQGLSKKTASSFRSQIRGLVSTANKQLSALRVKVKTSDINALRSGLLSSVDDTKTALSQLYTDMKNSGVGKTVQSAIQAAGGGIAKMRGALDTANDKLSTMKDFASSISDTLTGAFDATKSGSISDLLAGFSGATDSNIQYSTQLSGLLNRAKGNSVLTGFINQLATSGNTATLDTLAGSSASDLAQVSKAVAGYNTSVSTGVNAATTGKFGLTVGQQQSNIDALNRQMTAAVNTMGQILALIPQIKLTIDGKQLDSKISAAQKRQLDNLVHQLQKGQR